MPLRDHFENPNHPTWQPVHGMWPAIIILHVIRRLSPWFHVPPKTHFGSYFKIDIGTVYTESDIGFGNWCGGGGTATLTLPELAVAV